MYFGVLQSSLSYSATTGALIEIVCYKSIYSYFFQCTSACNTVSVQITICSIEDVIGVFFSSLAYFDQKLAPARKK